MNIGFIGCGKMAAKMAEVVKKLDGFILYACAARDINSANDFKKAHSFKVAYGNYLDLINDKNIDLIYISNVTKAHKETMLECIKHNKNVLCEKPFCVDSNEAKEVVKEAKKHKVFLAEAIWTRYMDSSKKINDIINSGVIGRVYSVIANIGYAINKIPRMLDINGGGVLLDCGVYPINFALMSINKKVTDIDAKFIYTKSGVDEEDYINLSFKDNVHASLYNSMRSNIDCSGYIYGDKGYIKVDHVNHPHVIEIYSNDRPPKLIDKIMYDENISGYEYQWIEIKKLIEEGKKESISMPLNETLYVMELLDKIKEKAKN